MKSKLDEVRGFQGASCEPRLHLNLHH